jgi:hypothetical protein
MRSRLAWISVLFRRPPLTAEMERHGEAVDQAAQPQSINAHNPAPAFVWFVVKKPPLDQPCSARWKTMLLGAVAHTPPRLSVRSSKPLSPDLLPASPGRVIDLLVSPGRSMTKSPTGGAANAKDTIAATACVLTQ